MIGQRFSPILEAMENDLWEFEAKYGVQPEYSTEGFRAIIKLFMSALMDKIWDLQEDEKIDMQDRMKMVEQAGIDVMKLVKTYTNIDCHKLYKNERA